MRFSSREVEQLPEANGFRLVHQVGSHRKFTNGPRRVIVPAGRKDLPPGTLGSIIRQSGLAREVFR